MIILHSFNLYFSPLFVSINKHQDIFSFPSFQINPPVYTFHHVSFYHPHSFLSFTIFRQLNMALRYLHLLALACLVIISLVLIIIGGSLSAWCVKVANRFACHSLFYSNENFSCLFKLLPTSVIICLSISFVMFIILMIIREAKKEYQLVARFVNILVLSLAIVFIMIILLQWFHPPSLTSKPLIIATISDPIGNQTEPEINFSIITSKDPLYLPALEAQQRSIATYGYKINHGPNLFFAALILVLTTLLIFIIVHRVEEFV